MVFVRSPKGTEGEGRESEYQRFGLRKQLTINDIRALREGLSI